MKLRLRTLASSVFTYSKEHKSFSAEMSEFKGNEAILFQRIYDDACDEGFDFVSQWTQKVETFYLAETKKDGEGDLMFWKFKPVSNELAARGITVIIFND